MNPALLGSLRLMQAGNGESHVAGLATEAQRWPPEKRGELDAAIETIDRWLGFDAVSSEAILRKAKLQMAAGRDAAARERVAGGRHRARGAGRFEESSRDDSGCEIERTGDA